MFNRRWIEELETIPQDERVRPWRFCFPLLVWVSAVTCVFDTHVATFAQDASSEASVVLAKKLLNEGWDRAPKVRNEAQSWFESAPVEIRSQMVVRWAYALNRLHHRKYREIKPLVDELAQQDSSNSDFAYAQIWMATFVDEFEQSLALMQKLKQTMDTTKDLPQQQKVENYFRLGRIFGYLQGPFGKQVNRQSLENTLGKLQAGADEEAMRNFTEQREGVIAQYNQLMVTREKKQETELETLVRKQQVELEQQTTSLQQLEKQTEEARSSRERVVSDGEAAISKQKERLDAATAEWNRQQSLISSVGYEVNSLWFSISQIDHALETERDPVVRQRLILDHNYYLALVRDKEFNLGALQANAIGLDNELGASSANYNQAVSAVQARVNEIDQTISSAEYARNRANRRIRILQAEPKVSNTLVATIDAEAEALSSYDPFPADFLKQRLLDSLK